MGKVGSHSVFAGLKSLHLGVPLYHVHVLNNLDALEQNAEARLADLRDVQSGFEAARRVRGLLQANPDGRWDLVSMVRDPLRQALSAFFHGLPWLIPDIRQRWENGAISLGEITELFLTKHNHNVAVQWFECQLRHVFSIDVFSTPFPHERGYQIYRHRNVRMLMLRLEDLNRVADPAFRDFLGISDFRPPQLNQADDRWYSDLYRRYLVSAVFAPDFLDRMYGSTVAKHFYSAAELKRFRSHWKEHC
jgi:hypothetical protein